MLRVMIIMSLLACNALPAQAEDCVVVLETAGQGCSNGGTSITDCSYLGARFEISEPRRITGIGGHVKSNSTWDRSIFIALVPVSGPDGFPSDAELSEAIFSTIFEAPFNDEGPYPYQVPDTIIQADLILEPGWYAIVFGSGLFGATGSGWMPVCGSIQPLPWFFHRNCFIDEEFHNRDEQPIRFIVESCPLECPADLDGDGEVRVSDLIILLASWGSCSE